MKADRFGAIPAIWLGALAGLGIQCTEDVRIVGQARPAVVGAAGTGGESGGSAGAAALPLGSFSVPRMIDELSDPDADDTEPTLTTDELEIYFTSTRIEQKKQVFVATRPSRSERWGVPALVQELVSATGSTYSPEVAGDGLRIWFVSDRLGGLGDVDLYFSVRTARSEPWSAPQNVTELNTEACEIDPGPLPEHNQMVITRCNAIGYNHILLAERASPETPWGPAVYLDQLNTDQKEGDPTFARDGLVLYFATTRESPNLDDRADIWRAARASLSAAFEPPAPAEGLNILEVDDQDPWVSNDERHVVFTSARDRWPREIYEAFR